MGVFFDGGRSFTIASSVVLSPFFSCVHFCTRFYKNAQNNVMLRLAMTSTRWFTYRYNSTRIDAEILPEEKNFPGRFGVMGRLISGVAAWICRRKRPEHLFDERRLLTILQDFGGYYSTEANFFELAAYRKQNGQFIWKSTKIDSDWHQDWMFSKQFERSRDDIHKVVCFE